MNHRYTTGALSDEQRNVCEPQAMSHFDDVAHVLINAATMPLATRIERLRQECPDIVRQIKEDGGRSGPTIFWGYCLNVDELAGQVIVDTAVLETIFAIARKPLLPGRLHAGLQHTYGYLFSLIDTPFGKKRDRWVKVELEAALGLPCDVLGPAPEHGTLLANATWLAGNIPFRGHARRTWLHRCLAKRVSPAIRQLDTDALSGFRCVETVVLSRRGQANHGFSLITDLVRMPLATDSEWLLVYSLGIEHHPAPQLITLFAVSREFVDSIHERAIQGQQDAIRPRYNAAVPGFPAVPQGGSVRWSAR